MYLVAVLNRVTFFSAAEQPSFRIHPVLLSVRLEDNIIILFDIIIRYVFNNYGIRYIMY